VSILFGTALLVVTTAIYVLAQSDPHDVARLFRPAPGQG